MEKSIFEMVGGEKHITPHYDIKAKSTSCYSAIEGFTGIEVNGVRFSNIGEMLRYMNKQRTQLLKAKELLTRFVMASVYFNGKETDLIKEAEHFLREVEK